MTDQQTALSGKIAIVVGGGTGAGRAISEALATAGVVPVIVGRRPEPVEAVARQIEANGGRALAMPADAADEAAVAGVVERTQGDLGGIDYLIYPAGIGRYGPVEHYALADWQATFASNLTGLFLFSRAVLPAMRERGGGAIIAIASGAGTQGYANLAAYSASKFGMIGFMQSLAAEVGESGIKVSTIVPGSIASDFAGRSAADRSARRDGKKYIAPEDVAAAVLYLLGQPHRAWTQELNLWPF